MSSGRPVWAEIDLGAVRHNVAVLAGLAAPAHVCAVVKAGAYGHGAVPVGRAAIKGGATWLAVAMVEEGAELRAAGVDAPILLLAEPTAAAIPEAFALGLTPTIYTPGGLAAAEAAAAGGSQASPWPVHVKVDTGMHRAGASPNDAVDIVAAVVASAGLSLGGVWTHFAAADDPANPFTTEQHQRFTDVLRRIEATGPTAGTGQGGTEGPGTEPGTGSAGPGTEPGTGSASGLGLVHSNNSAALLAGTGGRHDLVRCGITVYGVAPCRALAGVADLRPVMSLRARVAQVRTVPAGEGVSYGLHYRPHEPTIVATVPVGYADGVPWRLGSGTGPASDVSGSGRPGGEVLVKGRRRPIAGRVTMDHILVDCGPDSDVVPGDDVVLLGTQGDETIGAWEWAERAGTIAYEVLCAIGPRVPRVYAG